MLLNRNNNKTRKNPLLFKQLVIVFLLWAGLYLFLMNLQQQSLFVSSEKQAIEDKEDYELRRAQLQLRLDGYFITSENPFIRNRVRKACGKSWQPKYAQLHRAILQLKKERETAKIPLSKAHPMEKYVLYTCGFHFCGGWGDR